MIRLYCGSGAQDVDLLSSAMDQTEWLKLRSAAIRLLTVRDKQKAAELLESIPFEIIEATNYFQDKFCVLHVTMPIEEYAEMGKLESDQMVRSAFRAIAETITELGTYIRFILVSPKKASDPELVNSPKPSFTTEAVERALRDAENLLYSSGAPSAIDRVHTALHGYMRALCVNKGIQIEDRASLPEIFSTLRKNHPALSKVQESISEARRLLGAITTIVDSLNTIRNKASVAHPSDKLLAEPEAVLAINCGRTLLHYLDTKIKQVP